MNLIISLLVGLIAGWLAGNFVKGRGYGLLGDTLLGLIGGLVGGLLFGLLGLESSNIIGAILIFFAGAVVILSIAKFLKETT